MPRTVSSPGPKSQGFCGRRGFQEAQATLVCNAFIGAEAFLLLGLEDQGTPIRQALRRVGEAIRMLEEKHR